MQARTHAVELNLTPKLDSIRLAVTVLQQQSPKSSNKGRCAAGPEAGRELSLRTNHQLRADSPLQRGSDLWARHTGC